MPNQRVDGGWWPPGHNPSDPSDPSTVVPAGSSARRTGRAWAQFVGSIAALGALAVALPGPGSVVLLLRSRTPDRALGNPPNTTGIGDTAMLSAASAAVWLLLLWALLVAGAGLSSRLPGAAGRYGRSALGRVAPVAARRLVLTVVGASMVTGVAACGTGGAATAGPASVGAGAASGVAVAVGVGAADQATGSGDAHLRDDRIATDSRARRQAVSWIAVEGSAVHLRLPVGAGSPAKSAAADIDRPTGLLAPTGPAAPVDLDWPTSPRPAAAPVVVLRGDSLWSIAAGHLPPNAGQDDIDRAWRSWYATNAAVIGGNPSLILPGQILLPPQSGTGI